MNDIGTAARLTLPAGHDFEPTAFRSMQPTGMCGWGRRCRHCGEEWHWTTYWQRWERVRKGESGGPIDGRQRLAREGG